MFSSPSKKVPTGEFELNVRFLVPSSVIFEALTSTQAAQYYTQSQCTIEPKEGGSYMLYNGSIQGEFIFASDKKMELKWRRREWEEGVYSLATIQFIEIQHAVTELHLVQHDIPKHDRYNNAGVIESVEKGWIEMIFRRISMILGYVLQTEDEFELLVYLNKYYTN